MKKTLKFYIVIKIIVECSMNTTIILYAILTKLNYKNQAPCSNHGGAFERFIRCRPSRSANGSVELPRI